MFDQKNTAETKHVGKYFKSGSSNDAVELYITKSSKMSSK